MEGLLCVVYPRDGFLVNLRGVFVRGLLCLLVVGFSAISLVEVCLCLRNMCMLFCMLSLLSLCLPRLFELCFLLCMLYE